MDKLRAIIKREYLTRVRATSFILWTALSPLLMFGLTLAPLVVMRGLRQQQIISIIGEVVETQLK